MSQIVVSTITTHDNATPLYITTGNNTVGMDMHASNGAINLKGTVVHKNGVVLGAGKQTMWLPAAAFTARLTNGPALNQFLTTNGANYKTLDFDPSTQEVVEIAIRMPKSWDKGTISFTPVVSQLTTSAGAASWNLWTAVVTAGDIIDPPYGSPGVVTVSMGTANIMYIGSESAAISSANTALDGDLFVLALARAPAVGADTLAVDARLHGINMYYTANADSDL